jgi:hypothetical protein
MELRTVGETAVVKGQLLTLFVNDANSPSNHYFTLLYVKESFSVSNEMAEFYKNLPEELKTLPSETATEHFYLYLLKKGLVERPKSDVVHVGSIGRIPERISDEYKYMLNPDKFTLKKIQSDLMFQSLTFDNHQGYRIMILGPEGSLSEIIVDIQQNDRYLGVIKLGIVFDRTMDVEFDQSDIELMRKTVLKMVSEVSAVPNIQIGRIRLNILDVVVS